MNISRDTLSENHAAQVWLSILFLSVVMVTGILGNLLVFVVYCLDHSKVNNRSILALTVNDLINCLISIPGDIADLRYKYFFGESWFCPGKSLSVVFCSLASASILAAISVKRFQVVYKPLGKQTSLRTLTGAIFTSMVLSLCCAFPAVFVKGKVDGMVNGIATAECGVVNEDINKVHSIVLSLLFIVMVFILVILYSIIWHRLRRQKQFRDQRQSQAVEYNQKAQTVKVYKIGLKLENISPEIRPLASVSVEPSYASGGKIVDMDSNRFASMSSGNEIDKESSNDASTSGGIEVDKESSNDASTSGGNEINKDSSNDASTSGGNEINKDSSNDASKSRGNELDKEQNSATLTEVEPKIKTRKTKAISISPKGSKTTIMMLLVTAVFILSFLPSLGLIIAKAVDRKSFQDLTSVQLALSELFLRFHFLNSALNPFIYSFWSVRFREKLCLLRRRVMRAIRFG